MIILFFNLFPHSFILGVDYIVYPWATSQVESFFFLVLNLHNIFIVYET